ncbi:hypothetical protein PVAND_003137 [Polypedilum vanderplanki]|uniref:Structural maintenance of chromosomes protein 6 n=1 Tax=Polypedilum vanderplanki TaxID=319348 RepID=A0A9J6BU18_POLVA|nr:hypothetical protein PVAND_003137 [Polypedilum vanderplanki]
MGRKRVKEPASSKDESEEEISQEIPKKRVRKNTQSLQSSQNKENHVQNHAENAMQTITSLQPRAVSRNLPSSVISEKLAANLRSGKIKKIILQNFMCHSNFEVNLNRCVNVIVGLNGSGKSAILTAISIGLGSRAVATARSTNLKDLVRRGEASATIEITLANDGIDAYDYETYGDQITIVRTISAATGASSYKLKSENGRTVSTSRQDLVKMCMCLNIQVENPVLILNQDAARSFLKECDPKKLYSLFMKATQIEIIIEKLNSCFKTAVEAKNQTEVLNKTIKLYEADIEVIKQKHSRLQSVQSLRKKIENTKNEIAWIQVIIVENELSLVRNDLEKKKEEVRRLNDFINNKEKYEKEQKEKIRECGTSFKQLEQSSKIDAEKCEQARKDYDTENNKLSEFENTLKSHIEKVSKKIVPNIAQLEQEISDHENNPTSIDNLRRMNEAKIEELMTKQVDLKHVIENCKRDYQNFMQSLEDKDTEVDEYKKSLHREQDKVVRMENQISQYKNATKDKLSVYGPSMSQFLKDIENLTRQKRFSAMPRGPIGRFIEVPQQKYRETVENILEGFLTSFVVNNDQDRILLMKLKKKYPNLRPIQFITTEFVDQVYDISNGSVQISEGEGELLIDIMRVSDPVVMNCLIDHKKIERIVIVEDQRMAVHLTQHKQNVPKNLLRVILTNPFSDYFPAPNYRSYSLRSKPVRFIQVNFKELINAIQRDKVRQEERCLQLQSKIREIEVEKVKFKKLINNKKDMMNELQVKQSNYTKEIAEIQAVEYPDNTDIEYLRKNLNEEKERKIQIEAKIEHLKEKHQTLKDIVKNRKEVLDRYFAESRKSRDEMRKMQLEIEAAQRKLDLMQNEINTKGRQITALKDEEHAFLQRVLDLEGKIANMKSKIKGNRISKITHTEDYLKQTIRSAEHRIATIESNNESIEEVELLMKNKMDQVADMKQIHQTFEAVMKRLSELRESRYIFVRKLRQHMTLRVKHKFHQLMSLRNYTADIDIDHKEQILKLSVIPRDSEIEGAVSSTKSLSGGERSYSTVAFLISLWNCVDHPFYFLDEYDVFSDEYNRHIMTQLLLNEADRRKDKQFGFLTPQEFSNIVASNTITIHKLRDPDRLDN